MQHVPDYVPHYSITQAADAAGVTVDVLKNWVSRKPQVVLMTTEERGGMGRGHPLLFSFNRVMQIAVTRELVARGWTPRAATAAAVGFSDVGHSTNLPDGKCVVVRNPGELFPNGLTLLVAADPTELDCKSDVIEAPTDMPWPHMLASGNLRPLPPTFVVVNVSALYAQVRAKLVEFATP